MRRKVVAVIASLVALPACGGPLFFTDSPVTAYKDLRQRLDAQGVNDDLPFISIVINAAGGDAVDVYTERSEGTRITMAEDVAEWLGVDVAIAEPNLLEDNVATAQLERRLVTKQGDGWVLRFDTAGLLPIIHDAGYEGANLSVCHPSVAASFVSSRPPDFRAGDAGCYAGRGWEVLDENPVSVSLTLSPEANDYMVFVAAALLGILLLSALAWFVGSRLREGPFRRRNASAVAIGLVAGVFLLGGVAITVGNAATGLGPSDNLAMRNDLGVGTYALSALVPALAGAVPGLIFMVLLVKRRPWPEEPPMREATPWPAPPPPPPTPGVAPPPPLP